MRGASTAAISTGIVAALGLAVLIVLAAIAFDRVQTERYRQQSRTEVDEHLARFRTRIEAEINARIMLVDSLAAFAAANPNLTSAAFDSFAGALLQQRDGIRALQLAPGATVTYVVPLKGNEASVGHDLLADPQRAELVRRAIATRRLVLTDPVQLRQGGLAVVGRRPVFLGADEGADGRDLWGLAIVVLDVPPLLAQAGLAGPVADGLSLTIRGGSGAVFFGDAATVAKDAVTAEILFPSGQWTIAALPDGGWPQGWPGRAGLIVLTATAVLLVWAATAIITRLAAINGRALAVARESQARFHSLFDGAFQLIGTTTPDGTLTAANRTACDMVGVAGEDIVGRKFWDTPWWSHDAEQVERLKAGIAAAAAGRLVRFEASHRRPDGSTMWVDFSVKPVSESAGKIEELLVEGRDITERKAAELAIEEREALYYQMFLSNTAIKLLIDPASGAIVDANEGAVKFYGYTRERLIGMPIWAINTLSPDELRVEMAAAAAEDRNYFRFRHRLASGEVRRVEVLSGPVTRGGRALLHSIIHDVTDRDRFEAELARSNAELEQFAYVASHDLREPLRMVSGFVGLLDKRYGERLDQEGREMIAFALDGTRRMDRLILDLLEYSRVGRHQRPMEAATVDSLIAAALTQLGATIAECGARVSVDAGPCAVMADAGEIVRVVVNLVGNALKYRRADAVPEIRIATEDLGDMVAVQVGDNGIGIAAEFFERIFLIFQRLHGRDRYEGTGIGLALVKKIVERHGGCVAVESAGENLGSTFSFTLPKAGQ
ncbi:MAG: PAS domain S-box protein [Magnetospirillum sp.]|nr:PAS domain S-box protein [Magnetospirillum sp.]